MPITHDPDLERVFLDAIERPEAERSDFVLAAVDGDRDRARIVMELLAADGDNTDGTLDLAAHRLHEQVPTRIGAYRVLRALGQGGMGTVYEALQERPSRRVAVKVIRTGLATSRTLQRFESEADALAHLHHPGIIQVFEAGTAIVEHADGSRSPRPFIATELVEGSDVLAYAAGVSNLERITVIARIADAVHFAHQRGILHRDLKPANILVGAEGDPKIVDFGIAKLVIEPEDQPTSAPLLTLAGQVFGTPKYLSPEIAQRGLDHASTRSDVFALGVVLGEVLELPVPNASSAALAGSEASALPARPQVHPRDLRQIILTATHADPERRYQSAGDFAADLRRFLAGEPVQASGESRAYLVRRFILRHRVLVGLSVVSLAAILAALGTALIETRHANELARRESEARAASVAARSESEATLAVLTGMLTAADPSRMGPDVPLRQLIDKAAADLTTTSAGEPLVEARVRQTLGSTYESLGDFSRARTQFAVAQGLREKALGFDDPLTLESASRLGAALSTLGELKSAAELLEKVFQARVRASGMDAIESIGAAGDLASVLTKLGEFDRAGGLYSQALDAAKRTQSESTLTVLDVKREYAWFLALKGDPHGANDVFAEVLPAARALLGDDQLAISATPMRAASVARTLGNVAFAEQLLEDVVARRERILGPGHSETIGCKHDLAMLYLAQSRASDAEPLLRAVAESAAALLGPDHRNTLRSRLSLGHALLMLRRFDEALPLVRGAVERMSEASGEKSGEVADGHRVLGTLLAASGDDAGACIEFTRCIDTFTSMFGANYPLIRIAQLERGIARQRLGQFEPAIADLEAALRDSTLRPSPSPARRRQGLTSLAASYEATGRSADRQRIDARLRDADAASD